MGGWFFFTFISTIYLSFLVFDAWHRSTSKKENLIQKLNVAALYPYFAFNRIGRKINEKAFPLFRAFLTSSCCSWFVPGEPHHGKYDPVALWCPARVAVPLAEALVAHTRSHWWPRGSGQLPCSSSAGPFYLHRGF